MALSPTAMALQFRFHVCGGLFNQVYSVIAALQLAVQLVSIAAGPQASGPAVTSWTVLMPRMQIVHLEGHRHVSFVPASHFLDLGAIQAQLANFTGGLCPQCPAP
eukprot:RCo008748